MSLDSRGLERQLGLSVHFYGHCRNLSECANDAITPAKARAQRRLKNLDSELRRSGEAKASSKDWVSDKG
jgi:hypothetical protein